MFGVWGHKQAVEITYYGLHAMQHRGQDGAGVVVSDQETLRLHKDIGLVNDVFEQAEFADFGGSAAIGHIRNETKEENDYDTVQPFLFRFQSEDMAIASVGNIMNAYELRGELEAAGSIFQTPADTELLAHLIRCHVDLPMEEAIKKALGRLIGAYGFIILTEDKMYVALDAHGVRPLSIGRLGEAIVIASETCAFDIIGGRFEREVVPGELLIIDDDGMESTRFTPQAKRKLCAMEYVYHSRPDSNLNGVNVHAARKRTGIELGKEAPVEADVVTGVPDSSISAAIGYAEQTGLPYEMGVIKNRYVGRTFIKPSQELREQGVKMKLSPVRGIVKGKRVIMIDDSLIRGTTCQLIVGLLKEAGAKEVHVRIASPRIENPCFYGIDMQTREELMAAHYTNEEMAAIIGADSLAFLSVEGLERAIVKDTTIDQGICNACFTGNYAIRLED